MRLTTKFAIAGVTAVLAACSSNNANNVASENATETNAMTETTTTTSTTNVAGGMNAAGNTEVNAAGTSAYGNATTNNAM